MKLKALAIGAALVALAAIACTENGDTIVQTAGPQSGISVNGTGRVVGTPDVVLLTLGVSAERPTIDAARAAAAAAQKAVIDSLKANGVADKDIQTVQFSVQPQYDFSNRVQTLRGYRVSNTVSAKVRKLDTAGKAIDDALRAGGSDTVVQGVQFTIDDPTKLQAEARDLAMKDAKQRADQLAAGAGVKAGKPLSIVDSGGPSIPVAVAAPRTGVAVDEVETPIQPGELEIVVNVNVVYAVDD